MRAEAVCSNEYCRQYFADCGLTYADIMDGDILALVMMLNREIKLSNKLGETFTPLRLSEKTVIKHKNDGSISECYLFLNSDYFTRRECISFNRDGFIGFAGWADDRNTYPLRRAFLEWCEYLKKQKEAIT